MIVGVGTCPTCGGTIKDLPTKWLPEARLLFTEGHAVRFSKNEALLIDAMVAARANGTAGGCTKTQLFNAMYGLDPNGGPLSGEGIVAVMLSRMRHALRPLGLTVSAAPVYRLIPLVEAQHVLNRARPREAI